MLQGQGGLFGRLTELSIPGPLQLEPEQPMDGGGVPGRIEAFEIQGLTQHPNSLMGRRNHRPAQTALLNLTQQTHREKGLATPGVAAQDKRCAVCRSTQPT